MTQTAAADRPDAVPALVVNAGSSSLKLKWLPAGPSVTVERIGGDSLVRADGAEVPAGPLARHDEALELGLELLARERPLDAVRVVGHRVVHGGERFRGPVLVDDGVERAIERLADLAPLHNPPNLRAIRAARRRLPAVPHVAVFDTSFHASLPRRAFLTGLPMRYYRDHGIRRYGFHGTSHDYVSGRAAARLGRPREELRIVTLHLGNGASAAAVAGGRSVDTSMGFTPLDGLLMGTRTGTLDPGVVLHLLRAGHDVEALDGLFNRESGLRGVSGVSNDMRDVRAAAARGDEDARAALELFAYRVRTTVGAYAAAMGGLDAVVFTGGIGENDPQARAEACEGLRFLGLELDAERNAAARGEAPLHAEGSRVAVWLVPTDEEGMIARAARAVAADGRP